MERNRALIPRVEEDNLKSVNNRRQHVIKLLGITLGFLLLLHNPQPLLLLINLYIS